MTIAQWLVSAMSVLKEAGVQRGRTDCLVLLADLFNKDKSWVHAHPEIELNDEQLIKLNSQLNQRASHVPLAYIRGFAEFYKRKFKVTSDVLVPRPESEAFIDILKSLELEQPVIADIGTGSGCLGISAALELPESEVDLFDIEPEALEIADHNAKLHKVSVGVNESDLLSGLTKKYDVILANLPYVPADLVTSQEILKEPPIALFSGVDGLNHYRKFWQQIKQLTDRPVYVLTESLLSQHQENDVLAADSGYKLLKSEVLVQCFKLHTSK